MNLGTAPKLKLPTAPETAVFRAVVNQLTKNDVLERVIPPSSWHVFNGDKKSAARPAAPSRQGPEVTIWPTAAAGRWWTPTSQIVPLAINIELTSPGSCCDDLLNLWNVFRGAIDTGDPSVDNIFRTELQLLGALTGVVTWAQQAFDLSPQDDPEYLMAVGRMSIEVRVQ